MDMQYRARSYKQICGSECKNKPPKDFFSKKENF